MDKIMDKVISGIFLLVFGGFAYLSLLQPKIWLEWFFKKPSRSVGLSVTIENEKRFRQYSMVFGSFSLVFSVFLVWAIFYLK